MLLVIQLHLSPLSLGQRIGMEDIHDNKQSGHARMINNKVKSNKESASNGI